VDPHHCISSEHPKPHQHQPRLFLHATIVSTARVIRGSSMQKLCTNRHRKIDVSFIAIAAAAARVWEQRKLASASIITCSARGSGIDYNYLSKVLRHSEMI
jgi:hypothetical protein